LGKFGQFCRLKSWHLLRLENEDMFYKWSWHYQGPLL
jgi:hypothetical protein